MYTDGLHNTKDVYLQKFADLETLSNCYYSRSKKVFNITEFLREATPATENFEANNKEIIEFGNDVEQSDIR